MKKKNGLYVAPDSRGRPRKIGSPDEMADMWERYKEQCDCNIKTVRVSSTTDDGSGEEVKTITEQREILSPVTYTVRGFCLFCGISESNFNRTYASDEDYEEIMELIDMETEIDARSKFEDGTLSPKLAALWMGRHKGYSAKTETDIKGGVPVVISGEDDLAD